MRSSKRSVIKKHKAYEVKTVGDSFMIACTSAAVGVKIAMDIQTGVHAAVMPLAVDRCYAAKNEDERDNISDEPNVLKDGPERDTDPFNGPPPATHQEGRKEGSRGSGPGGTAPYSPQSLLIPFPRAKKRRASQR